MTRNTTPWWYSTNNYVSLTWHRVVCTPSFFGDYRHTYITFMRVSWICHALISGSKLCPIRRFDWQKRQPLAKLGEHGEAENSSIRHLGTTEKTVRLTQYLFVIHTHSVAFLFLIGLCSFQRPTNEAACRPVIEYHSFMIWHMHSCQGMHNCLNYVIVQRIQYSVQISYAAKI